MKNKKIFFMLFLVLIIILIILFFIIKSFNSKTTSDENMPLSDYTPEEEISSKQLRETVITLYFPDTNNELKSEGKLIDSLDLVNNPYQKIIELLLEGPQSENLFKAFPENTKIIDVKLQNNCAILNFSEELLNYEDENQKYNIINSLLNTLTELNEVNSIQILVNNDLPKDFETEYTLKNPLTKSE